MMVRHTPSETKTRWIWSLHPFLAAVSPVLLFASVNRDRVYLPDLVVPLMVSVLGTVILFGLSWLAYRRSAPAALFTSLCVIAFFSHGHLHRMVTMSGIGLSSRSINLLLYAVWFFSLALVARSLSRSLRWHYDASRVLTVTLLLLVIQSAFRLCWAEANVSAQSSPGIAESSGELDRRVHEIPPASDSQVPDIYYVILDGYGRADQLLTHYKFDNSPFLEALRSRNFYVADRSTSNYAVTFLSLASSLNVRYVNEDAARIGKAGAFRGPINELIRNHAVGRYLKRRGYKYIQFSSGWTPTDSSRIADMLTPFALPESCAVFAETTALEPFVWRRVIPGLKLPTRADLHRYVFDRLPDVRKQFGRSPVFVFAHVICPHPPYVLDRNGKKRSNSSQAMGNQDDWQKKDLYLEQLRYVNRRVLEVVDAIIAQSQHPPIIIIQSDHGTATTIREDVPLDRQREFARERMSILNAYFVPNAYKEDLYREISPVNSFRVVFRHLFKEELDLLPDRCYLSWYRAPYVFSDVTQVVRGDPDPVSRPRGCDADR